VIDGLEEATHDQMLEARREELEQEGEIFESSSAEAAADPVAAKDPIFVQAQAC